MTDIVATQSSTSVPPEGHVIPYRAGFFQTQFVKRGVMVAVRLWLGFGKQDGRELDEAGNWSLVIARGWQWRAMRDGVEVHPWKVWPGCSGNEISLEEYRYLLARRDHATRHDTDSPFASPRQKVDFNTVKHNLPDRRITQ